MAKRPVRTEVFRPAEQARGQQIGGRVSDHDLGDDQRRRDDHDDLVGHVAPQVARPGRIAQKQERRQQDQQRLQEVDQRRWHDSAITRHEAGQCHQALALSR